MSGVDVGNSGGHKRATNSDINMIPFIDLLMCTIAFLLITAVWVTNSQLPANAQVPGSQKDEITPPKVERTLHLTVNENDFSLVWRHAGTVLSEIHVPKTAVQVGTGNDTVAQYDELKKAVAKDWGQYREHWDPNDKTQDTMVLHSDNRAPFKELIAVLDAVNALKRDRVAPDGKLVKIAAFSPTFSAR
jgi:biopolymer transport protein ExbD